MTTDVHGRMLKQHFLNLMAAMGGTNCFSALTADISTMDLKKRVGETGVELRWHKHEWRKLARAATMPSGQQIE